MSDRSTEDVLEETERLLEGEFDGDGQADPPVDRDVDAGRSGQRAVGADRAIGADAASTHTEGAEAADDSSSWRSRLRPSLPRPTARLGLDELFSPRAFLLLVLALSAGLLIGGTAIPVAGEWLGLAGSAFLIGAIGRTRRYLELGAAGVSVGAIGALVEYAVIAALNSGGAIVAVGAGAGLAACLVGYYFGRDLRNGLVRDVP